MMFMKMSFCSEVTRGTDVDTADTVVP